MPKDECDPDDPLEMVACVIPGDQADTERMARCLVEEFFLMDWSGERILALFKDPFYRAPHGVYQQFGEDWVKALIEDVACALRERWLKRKADSLPAT